MPIEPLRAELRRVFETHPLWKGEVCGLQITDGRERDEEIRCLTSIADSMRCGDLQGAIYEASIAFLRNKYPEVLRACERNSTHARAR